MVSNASHQAGLSRLFSSAVFREMAATGKSRLFARLGKECNLFTEAGTRRVRDVFDLAFSYLKITGSRDEYVYKSALTQRILLGRHNLNTACMLTEFRAGSCKADVAILNGTTTVYEIKSERDSLTRLQRQIACYRDVFASVVVVAGENHVEAVLRSTPRDVGVMSLSKRHQLSTLRECRDQPERICPLAILETVRTDEAKEMLAYLGHSMPAVPNTLMRRELQVRFGVLRPKDVHAAMLHVLKSTRDMKPLAAFVSQLPGSLHAAALTIPLRRSDQAKVLDAVNAPLEHAVAWS